MGIHRLFVVRSAIRMRPRNVSENAGGGRTIASANPRLISCGGSCCNFSLVLTARYGVPKISTGKDRLLEIRN